MRYASIVSVCSSLLLVSSGAAIAMGSKPVADLEGANNRILPVAQVKLAPPAAAAAKDRSGEELYKSVCAACHATGVAGAPKMGDKAAWAALLKEGLDVLVTDATKGIRGMPPRGGSDASDQEMRRAVIFITNNSGANFK
jgi:cytochrome c5